MPSPPLPLAGLRVLELSDGKAEMCGRILADLGADVLLVEPFGGAASRRRQPMIGGVSLYFATHNANKRSTEIDLDSLDGRTEFLALVDGADILIEATATGWLDGQSLGFENLHARNPALVFLAISDFGQTGPYRSWQGTAEVFMALNSVLARSGTSGKRPLLPPGDLATETAAVQAAWVALVAYWQRLRTGVGQYVDLSVFEASLQTMDPPFGISGSAAVPQATRQPGRGRPDARYRYPIFACADGFVCLCLLAPRQWRAMYRWLGEPMEFADRSFDDLWVRFAHADSLYPLIAQHFKTQPRAQLLERAEELGVPLESVNSPTEVLADEHFRARGTWTEVQLDASTTGVMPNGFFELDGTRVGIQRSAPSAGRRGATFSQRTAARDATSVEEGPPFAGLRVLDLGVIVVGAEAGRLFADLGADVVKIECEAHPDGSRQSGMTPALACGQRNKRSLGLDLRSDAGKQIFLALVAQSDVVLSNFKPGTMEALGFAPAALRLVNPRIVTVESSALGATGPSSRRLGYGPLVRAATGLTSLWRYPETVDGFCDSVTVFPDHVASRASAVGALALLIARRRDGVGGTVRIAQAEVLLAALGDLFLRESLAPQSVVAQGNQREFDAPAGVYPCLGADEWCVISVRGDEDWRRLCEVTGGERLVGDPSLSTAAGRVRQRVRLDRHLEGYTSARTPSEVAQRLQQAQVPAAMMHRVEDLPSDPQVLERKFLRSLDQPSLGPVRTEGGPATFGAMDLPLLRPAPVFAQDSRQVLTDFLGLDDQTMDDLIASGTIEVGGQP